MLLSGAWRLLWNHSAFFQWSEYLFSYSCLQVEVNSALCSNLQTQEDQSSAVDSTCADHTDGVCSAVDHCSLWTAAVGQDLGADPLDHRSALPALIPQFGPQVALAGCWWTREPLHNSTSASYVGLALSDTLCYPTVYLYFLFMKEKKRWYFNFQMNFV